uniref:Uncharacterized protein n=1 Tax=Klebsiella pneumoniae TaxID=573 RepID=A0A8B0SV37_KLEPN|nr:hypothetical protein [Klebsiella pneumoniae]
MFFCFRDHLQFPVQGHFLKQLTLYPPSFWFNNHAMMFNFVFLNTGEKNLSIQLSAFAMSRPFFKHRCESTGHEFPPFAYVVWDISWFRAFRVSQYSSRIFLSLLISVTRYSEPSFR